MHFLIIYDLHFLTYVVPLDSLTDPEREKYNSVGIIQAWESCYQERRSKLVVSEIKRKQAVAKYLRSFYCLCLPLGIALVSIL